MAKQGQQDQTINFVQGDATAPQGEGPAVIAHVCNDIGGWGRGFVLALSQRWNEPEQDYRRWYATGAAEGFALGATRLVQVEPNVWVANMIGQEGIHAGPDGPPVRYWAIEAALSELAAEATVMDATVHMPRIGCGLAGGEWPVVEAIIDRTLVAAGVPVVVYDL